MSNIKLAWLADELEAAGLNVFRNPGWETHTSPTNSAFNPVGLLNHHTAGSSILYNYPNPPYWPPERLKDSCNITIRPDGRVDVVNAGYAYDSGQGDPDVLARLLADEEVTVPIDRRASDRILGNPYFIDIEVQHLGNGDPIAPAQHTALIATNAVICTHYGWNPMTRILGHRDWTLRKTDPKWSGTSNPMHAIRVKTQERMEEEVIDRNTKADDGLASLKDNFDALVAAGVFSGATQPGGVTFNDEFGTFLIRFENYIVRKYRLADAVRRGDDINVT